MKLDLVTVGFWLEGVDLEADVRRLRYVEGLSELCEADLVLTLPLADAAKVKPGAKARVTLERGIDHDNVRSICGLVRSVEHLDQGDGMSLDRPLLRVTIVPRVWLTSLSRRTRPFVDRSIDDIVSAVLSEVGLSIAGTASTGVSPLMVQYQETDMALMFRLLEDIGVTHYVEHSESQDTWTLFKADPATTRSRPRRRLRWTSLMEGQSDDEGVVRAGRIDGMTPRSFAVADIDRRVEARSWEGTASRPKGESARQELRETWRVAGDSPSQAAQRASDERRPEQERFWLETSDMQLKAGELIEAELSRGDAENNVTTDLLVARVEHEVETGEDGVVYRNRAEAVTYASAFRPARVTPKPVILAPQTGIVTSFAEGKQLVVNVTMDWGAQEGFPIPVRMTQPIAGSNHGAVLVPHINSEVVVHFLDGVPERPVLIGALYNKTQQASVSAAAGGDSSYQSRLTMLGARGPTNVIEVDDATQDSEIVRMTAINDVSVKVGRNEARLVEGTYDETIKKDVTVELGARRSTTVEADDTYETNGNVSVTVHKAGRVLVNQTLQMTADTKLSLISGNTRADFSPSAAKITVGGAVIEMTASGIKISVGAASVELNPGQVKIGGPIVDINNGALQVM